MNESILKVLMQLAALVAQINQMHFKRNAHALIKAYLEQTPHHKNKREIIIKYLEIYSDYNVKYELILKKYNPEIIKEEVKKLCIELNTQLSINEKFILLFSILELINCDCNITEEEAFLTESLSNELKIEENEYHKAFDFIIHEIPENCNIKDYCIVENSSIENADELEGSWIEKNKPFNDLNCHILDRSGLTGKIYFLRFNQPNFIIFKYIGSDKLTFIKQPIVKNKYYNLKPYDHIFLNNSKIEYFDIIEVFRSEQPLKIYFNGFNIHSFKSKTKIQFEHCFNFSETSGTLIGVVGNQPTTNALIDNISGRAHKFTGSVLLNHFNLYNEFYKIYKYVGLVQDIATYSDQFTIFENVRHIAEITFTNHSPIEIIDKTNDVIEFCGLTEIKHTYPKDINQYFPENLKYTLINLAIELVREPVLLFVKCPNLILHSSDYHFILQKLKKYVQNGNIAFVASLELNENILSYTDKLWLFDDDNYIIYNNDTHQVLNYFNHFDLFPSSAETYVLENIEYKSEKISNIIKQKKLDETGNITPWRKITPKVWNERFKSTELPILNSEYRKVLPNHDSRFASFDQQYLKIIGNYFKQNIRKLLDKPKELIFFTAIAILFSAFMRTDWSSSYSFGNNPNIFNYSLISFFILFVRGFILAENKNQKEMHIIRQNTFRNLSYFSIFNAQLSWWLVSSAVSSLFYTVIGCILLNTSIFFNSYFLLFFTVSILGNLTGILLSNLFQKRMLTYSFFFIILTYNLVFNGITINPKNYPGIINSKNNISVLSDFSPIKWAMEAIIVEQSINNKFENNLYPMDKKIEITKYNANSLIPALQQKLANIGENDIKYLNKKILSVIQNEIKHLPDNNPEIFPFEYLESLVPMKITNKLISEAVDYLTYAQITLNEQLIVLQNQKIKLEQHIKDSVGNSNFEKFKLTNFNSFLFDLVNNYKSNLLVTFSEHSVIKQINPLYLNPVSNFGRSHLFAPVKLFNNFYYQTYWFNLFFMWMYIFTIYISISCIPFKKINIVL